MLKDTRRCEICLTPLALPGPYCVDCANKLISRFLTQRNCSYCSKPFNPRESEYQYFCSYDCYKADKDNCEYCHPKEG